MKYCISYTKPHNHFIDIEFIAEKINSEETFIQLPAWRPGRYELGNFAKNIQKWAASDDKGKPLPFKKINKDLWAVNTKGIHTLHIKYNYYAHELNAGSTFLDENQLYVNPVNCLLYLPERINDACELEIKIPTDYIIASGLTKTKTTNENVFSCKNFHELADSPFIASKSLQHKTYECNKILFHLWFQGESNPDWDKLLNDFKKFTSHQLEMMQNFPTKEYHFLFQILPYQSYHGVEHITSTVILLGPGCNLMNTNVYENLLGVSCHELFHVWNVKTIRPIEMQPYNYSKENYSTLGYVYEGVTTYYGDYLLYRSKVFTEEQYLVTLNEQLQKHFDNPGRFNLSVGDSSFDTWLDGYVPGIPNRKTNIYTEGCLLALATDIFIRKNSGNKNSLDDVMRHLNTEFAEKGIGYSEKDYKGIIEHNANQSFDAIFNSYYLGTADYYPLLEDAFYYLGYQLVKTHNNNCCEKMLGIKFIEANSIVKLIAVLPESLADKSGLSVNDEILTINSIQLGKGVSINDWCNHFKNKTLEITVGSMGKVKTILLNPQNESYYPKITVSKLANINPEQKRNHTLWSKQ